METEELFQPDYFDYLDEEGKPISGNLESKKKKTKAPSFCVICKGKTTHLKRHVVRAHLPIQFDSDKYACSECCHIIVENLLRLVINSMLSR